MKRFIGVFLATGSLRSSYYLNTHKRKKVFVEVPGIDSGPCIRSGTSDAALALLHHLHVSGNLPIAVIRDLFYDMTREYLILEFVPTHDPMFEQLMKFRIDLYQGLTLEFCRQVFEERFVVVLEKPISGSPRHLLFLRKRN